MNKNTSTIIKTLKRKFRFSLYTYAFLAICLFLLTSLIIFFNLFAVRFNPAKYSEVPEEINRLKTEQIIFIVITVLTSLATFLGGCATLFNFEKKAKIIKSKLTQIQVEITNFNAKKGKYENIQNDELLINSVSKIIKHFDTN